MASVENRVVAMTFDNKNFQANILETIASLDILKQSLNIEGAGKSLDDLNASAKKFDASAISRGIEGVSKSFIAFSTVAITAIQNVVNRAVDAGIQIAKGLSLDGVLSGFAEYELNMNSIQTILANTRKQGTDLQDVNAALDELNEYSDLTIYNFAQMTKNIGSATAAGVDLDTSVQYVKGFANSAAVAGVSAEEMAGAMIQMSQALGAGVIKAQDWISLERRGLATQVTQEAFYETAKAMGTLADVPLDKSFAEWSDEGNTLKASLADGWLTADVFLNTMKVFTGEMDAATLASMGFSEAAIPAMLELGQVGVESATKVRTLTQLFDTAKEAVGSGWSQTFRIIFGDFNEATELFSGLATAFGDYVGESAASRNEFFRGWKEDYGGRALLIQALGNAFYGLKRIMQPIREAFRTIFPKKTSEDLFELTQRFALFAQTLIPAPETMRLLRKAFTGFFAGIKIGLAVIGEVINLFQELFQAIKIRLDGKLLVWFAEFADKITYLYVQLVLLGDLATYFDNFKNAIQDFFTTLFAPAEGESRLSGLTDKVNEFKDSFKGFDRLGDSFSKIWEGISTVASRIGDALSSLWSGISGIFTGFWDRLSEVFEETDYDGFLDTVNTGILAAIGVAIGKIAYGGIDIDFDGVGEAVREGLESLTGALTAMQAKLQADTLTKLAIAIGVLTASVVTLSLIDSEALAKALAAMAVGFGQLFGAMLGLAKATSSIGGVGGLFFLSSALIKIASSMLILSIAMKILSTLSWEEIGKGLTAITVLLGELVLAVQFLAGNLTGLVRAGFSILLLATALTVLAVAMKIFATMSWEEIGKGLAAVTALLIGLVVAVQFLAGNLSGVIRASFSILVLASALTVLAVAMKIFATMSWEEIGRGLTAVAALLIGLTTAVNFLAGNTSGLVRAGLAIALIGGAMLALAVAMKILGSLSWDEMQKGLIAVGYALLVMGLAAYALQGSIGGGVAIAVMASSLIALAIALKMLGSLSIGQLAAGLAAIAITLGILFAAAILGGAAVPALLALGAAIFLIGAGFALIGAGAALAVAAFATFAGIAGAAVGAVIRGIGQFITALPGFIIGIVQAFATLVQELTKYAPVFFEFMTTMILGTLQVIIDSMPMIVETFIVIIQGLIEAGRELLPDLVQFGFDIILGLLGGIRDNMGEITDAAVDIVLEFIGALTARVPEISKAGADYIIALIQGIQESMSDIISAGVDAVLAFVQGIADNMVKVVDKGFEIVINFLNGLATTIENRRGELAEAGLNLLSAIFGGITGFWTDTVQPWFGDFINKVKTAIGDALSALFSVGWDFINGLYDGAIGAWNWVWIWISGIGGRAFEAVKSGLGSLWGVGWNWMQGLWNGLKDKAQSVLDWIWDFATDAVYYLTHPWDLLSPSRVTRQIGEYFMEGLAIGMERNGPKVLDGISDFAHKASEQLAVGFTVDEKELTQPITNLVSTALAKMSELDGINHNPTITPVLDLTRIQSGVKDMTRLLGVDSAYAVADSIASTAYDLDEFGNPTGTSGDVVFNQTINAPTKLATSDIYRQTRSQITLAKEELSIP